MYLFVHLLVYLLISLALTATKMKLNGNEFPKVTDMIYIISIIYRVYLDGLATSENKSNLVEDNINVAGGRNNF